MAELNTFIFYTGDVDYKKIDSLLKKLKNRQEYKELDRTTGKRVYSILVECLENIAKYSYTKHPLKNSEKPFISVGKNSSKIVIKAGNPIDENKKTILYKKLRQVNKLADEEITAIYEKVISKGMRQGANGAGLGLLIMKLKSGNKFEFSFKQIDGNLSFFEIQISINKYIMRKLIIEKTESTPKVILDPDKKLFEISGESRPSDVREFYDKILSWLDEFSMYHINSTEKSDPIIFNFNFEYFNSSSGKLILDICKILADLRSKGINVNVNWHFEKDDFDMLEVGKEMSRIVKFPFEYIETSIN